MTDRAQEIQKVATQLLAGLLANPQIYPKVSDEMSRGQQEQELLLMALELAQNLVEKVENSGE